VIGFELMTLTSAYSYFMATQVRLLQLERGKNVVDLGAGTGAFADFLDRNGLRDGLRMIAEVDFVREGLRRARSRMASATNVAFVDANIDLANGKRLGIPFAREKVDAVIASLFLSYVENPGFVLKEILRVLRPGGRLVVSTLRRDADMSKLLVEGVQELRGKWESELSTWGAKVEFDRAVRGYMNEASRLLDLEESGRFSFWDANEFRALLVAEGFEDVDVTESFGDPPQAIIAVGRRSTG
jgi:ubiquinone/menaquinone biosynthesis C-methylase UbiE